MFCVSEHGRIFEAGWSESLPDGNLLLRKEKFESLLTMLEEPDQEASDYSPIFTYLRPQGKPQLKVQNYVGVIRVDDDTQIEILPKIAKRLEIEQARDLLVRMLIELQESPFFEGNAADLQAHKMPLFELLIRCFLEHVAGVVRKGIARTYVDRQDNLVFLRGKISLSEHIRRNSYSSSRVFCEFDEYEANRPINRLLKGALLIAQALTRDASNQQHSRELLYWFDGVPATANFRLDFKRVHRDRLVQHYAPAMPLCRLILEQLNPLTKQGRISVVSMLFPMEKVFEDYVASRLRRQMRGWRISEQATGHALVESHMGRRMFNLRPDLLFSRSGQRVIGDTKWKLLDQSNRANRYGISQADIYQLFAYSKKFLHGQERREVLLIYPATETFQIPLEPFWYQTSTEALYVVPFDLIEDKLVLPEESLLIEHISSTPRLVV